MKVTTIDTSQEIGRASQLTTVYLATNGNRTSSRQNGRLNVLWLITETGLRGGPQTPPQQISPTLHPRYSQIVRCSMRQNNRPHILPEIPASDFPCSVERHGLMSRINHRPGRSAHRLESGQCQPSEALKIILGADAVGRGDGSCDPVDMLVDGGGDHAMGFSPNSDLPQTNSFRPSG